MGVDLAKAVALKLVYADDDAGSAEAEHYEKLIACQARPFRMQWPHAKSLPGSSTPAAPPAAPRA